MNKKPIQFKGARFKVDMKSFLSQHDLVYKSAPKIWQDGFPIGNGDIGALVYKPHHLEWGINKSDVWDRRHPPSTFYTHQEVMKLIKERGREWLEEWGGDPPIDIFSIEPSGKQYGEFAMRDRGRWTAPYPSPKYCGYLRIYQRDNPIQEMAQRLCLYDGLVISEGSGVKAVSFVDAYSNVMVVNCAFEGVEKTRSPSRGVTLYRRTDESLGTIPASGCDEKYFWIDYGFPDGFRYVMLTAISGAEYETEKEDNQSSARLASEGSGEFTVFMSVATSRESDDPLRKAKGLVDAAMSKGYERLLEGHKDGWHSFWSQSFVDLSDNFAENLWYLQVYNLACISRSDVVPNKEGLWNLKEGAGWKGCYVGSANTQAYYWPIFTTNHLELGKPYYETFYKMLATVKEETMQLYGIDGAHYPQDCVDTGLELAWGQYRYMQCAPAFTVLLFWWHFLYTRDEKFLKERAYSVMKESVRFYQGYMSRDDEGKYYIYPSYSPEQGAPFIKNPTMDLAMIKALLKGTIESSVLLGVDEEERQEWINMLNNLSDYPTDETIFLEYEGAPPDIPVHHPSRLSVIYPGAEIGIDHPLWEMAKATLESMLDPKLGARFFDFVASGSFGLGWMAAVAAHLGLGDKAREVLYHGNIFTRLKPNGVFSLHPLTEFTLKQRQKNQPNDAPPSIEKLREVETARPEGSGVFLCGVNEMLLQSLDGTIRVFPAMPTGWSGRIANLRAVGAFLICSEFGRGEVRYISIQSLMGQRCKIANPWSGEEVRVVDLGTGKVVTRTSEGTITFDTTGGSAYIVEKEGQPWASFSQEVIGGEERTEPRKVEVKGQTIWLGKM